MGYALGKMRWVADSIRDHCKNARTSYECSQGSKLAQVVGTMETYANIHEEAAGICKDDQMAPLDEFTMKSGGNSRLYAKFMLSM